MSSGVEVFPRAPLPCFHTLDAVTVPMQRKKLLRDLFVQAEAVRRIVLGGHVSRNDNRKMVRSLDNKLEKLHSEHRITMPEWIALNTVLKGPKATIEAPM